MIILLCNDDGIHSEGLTAIEAALREVGEIYTVAPDRAQSSMSHALTLHRPLRVQELAPRRMAVDGTPVDCVKLSLTGLLPVRPDLVISGINKGPNLGDDIIYSGTVSAAIEGALLGIPAIAVSLVTFKDFDFRVAAEFTAELVERIAERGIPAKTLLNVNVPPGAKNDIRGWRRGRNRLQSRERGLYFSDAAAGRLDGLQVIAEQHPAEIFLAIDFCARQFSWKATKIGMRTSESTNGSGPRAFSKRGRWRPRP